MNKNNEDKPKIHKLTIALGIVGIFVIIASTIRWFFLFPDYSQFAIAVGVGVAFVGFAYIYETIKVIDKRIEDFDHALDALNIYYRNEVEKLWAEINIINNKIEEKDIQMKGGLKKDE